MLKWWEWCSLNGKKKKTLVEPKKKKKKNLPRAQDADMSRAPTASPAVVTAAI